MATAATKTAPAVQSKGSTEVFESFVNEIVDGLNRESDLLSTVATSMQPKLVRLLQKNGLDGARFAGMGSNASAAAKAVTRHLQVAAEHEDSAARAVKKAFLEYIKNIVEPVLQAQQSDQEWQV